MNQVEAINSVTEAVARLIVMVKLASIQTKFFQFPKPL